MSERVTINTARRTAVQLAGVLAGYGWADAHRIDVRAPYGRVWYVVTVKDDGHGIEAHNVPGFEGSGGSGAVTPRELVERMHAVIRFMHEGARAGLIDCIYDPLAADAARATVAARMGVTE